MGHEYVPRYKQFFSTIDIVFLSTTLQWRHNELACISNHQPHHCLLNRLFTHKSKKTSKLRVTGLCVGNSPVIGEFPAQRASSAENVSIWLRHHEISLLDSNTQTKCGIATSVLFDWFTIKLYWKSVLVWYKGTRHGSVVKCSYIRSCATSN